MRTSGQIVESMRASRTELREIQAELEHLEWLLAQANARKWTAQQRLLNLDNELDALVDDTRPVNG